MAVRITLKLENLIQDKCICIIHHYLNLKPPQSTFVFRCCCFPSRFPHYCRCDLYDKSSTHHALATKCIWRAHINSCKICRYFLYRWCNSNMLNLNGHKSESHTIHSCAQPREKSTRNYSRISQFDANQGADAVLKCLSMFFCYKYIWKIV